MSQEMNEPGRTSALPAGLPVLLLTAFLLLTNPGRTADTSPISVIPRPQQVTMTGGSFILTSGTAICCGSEARNVARYLAGLLRPATGFPFQIKPHLPGPGIPDRIILALVKNDLELAGETYRVQVAPTRVRLSAAKREGLLCAVQTLRQILPPALEDTLVRTQTAWVLPGLVITDRPRFSWRGLHLDVARHFFPLSFLKKYTDLLALLKLNTFHLHLTDDQGWRLEIKKYPELTRVGSRRRSGRGEYGGVYTQDQIRDLVGYARDRAVTIVPEIEMPGHATAALAAYPRLGCTGGPYTVKTTWGPGRDVFCAGNEQVYSFLQDVLTEVLALFPSPYIHVGGDECPHRRWKACPRCRAKMNSEKLKNPDQLHSYFIRRINTFLQERGRTLIGWDEILKGGLAPGAAVMSWQGFRGGVTAARAGHPVVMSPRTHCYFDYYQSRDRKAEPRAIGGFLPLSKVYAFEPVPPGLSPEQARHIRGAQGNVWTEYISSGEQVEYMAFPRAAALAEVLWSPAEDRDYEDFLRRLRPLLQRLKNLQINYRDPF